MLTLLARLSSVAVVALCLAPSFAAAAPPTRYFDGVAREIVSNLKAGNGWAVVSDRQNIQVDPVFAETVDAVRYQIVTKHQSGTTSNGQFYVELELSNPTPWIFTSFKTATASCPSLTLAQQANAAVAEIDETLPLLEKATAEEENAEVRALGNKVIAIIQAQRTAMIDLIQKDIQSVH